MPDTEPMTLVTFASPSRLLRETDRRSDLPIVRNGPPGTFVVFPTRLRVSLPTDQIVLAHERDGGVQVGFGGMAFDGESGGRLVFQRLRDLVPESQLSPDRSWTMTLEPEWVTAVDVDARRVWPRDP